jgi:hypothetical protein
MEMKQSIYFDINIFRSITRKLEHWDRFEEFFDNEEPGLLDSSVIFTWAQLLEAVDLGKIMAGIKKSLAWKNLIENKKILDRFPPHESLNQQFYAAVSAVASLPSLQKDALLQSIDKAVSHTCREAKPLVDNTFLRYRACVSSNNYMEQLSREIAWAFITSQSFVMSNSQWEERKKCYESLMALWHTLHLEGHDLVFFRMSEMQYFSYLKYASDLDLNKALRLYPQARNRQGIVNEIFKFPPLKAEGDLCDGEIIDFCRLGSSLKNGEVKMPVIGITMDNPYKMDQRAGVFLRSLQDLERSVNGWNIKPCPGKIFSINIANDGKIQSPHRILLGQAETKRTDLV